MLARRALLWSAGLAVAVPAAAGEADEDAVIRQAIGQEAVLSDRVRLMLPAAFANGGGVPLSLAVDSAMTEDEHIRQVQVLAPRNPIVLTAAFRFTPRSGRVMVATRIRLAQSQTVLALAETSAGTWLLARRAVTVDTNGCA
jgi:sulfur-oxidizing protein SoxY